MTIQRIPFARQSYVLQSVPLSAQRLVNLFAEQQPQESRSPLILKPAPGLYPIYSIGAGPIYALAGLPGIFYAVSGSQFWRMAPNADYSAVTPTLLGDIGLTATPTIAVGPTQVVVVSPPNAYCATHGGTLGQITDPNFPGASSVCYLDGWFVFTSEDGSEFFCSNILDGTTYNALNFAKSEALPDYTQMVVSFQEELWLFGQAHTEVWYDAGTANFPFARQTGGVLPTTGIAAPASVCALDNSLFWLGQDRTVYRTANGYLPARVSTHAIEELLAAYPSVLDISAFPITFEGHPWYVLTLPSAPNGGATFVYDCATQLWHERSSAISGAGRWAGNRALQWGPYILVGDNNSGTIHQLVALLGTEEGLPITRIATLPPLWGGTKRAFMSRLDLEMETGGAYSPGQVTLDWSDDGGWTFAGGPRAANTGTASQYSQRVFWTRLGSFRQRVLRLTLKGTTTLYAADADIGAGAA